MATTRPKYVLGPTGQITVDTLPTANTARWTARRKAEVIAAIHGGLVTRAWALNTYKHLTDNELRYWETTYRKFGLDGLKVTKVHEHR